MNAMPRLAREGARSIPRRMNFTKEALAGLRCPADRKAVAVYDTKGPGLVYVIRSTGFRAFYWYGRIRGEHAPIRHLIGGDEFSIDLARRRATETSINAKDGINPKAAIRARREANKSRRRLGELWQKYHDEFLVTRSRAKTRVTHESLWRVWIEPWGGNRPIDEIDADDLRALQAAIAKGRQRQATDNEKGRGTARRLGGQRTANKAIALLRRIFNYSKAENPVKPGVVEMFKQHSRERYLTPPELKRFFESLGREQDATARDFIELALFTGARRSNVQSMRWDEIDADAQTWTIPAEKGKAGKPIDVPLTAPALEVIERRRKANARRDVPSPFVLWSDRARSGHIMEPKFAFARICKDAGIRNLTIHDLRRTLGSWQAALGASLPIIGRSLGHANINSTAIYSRINIDPVRASVNGAVSAMMATAGRTPKEEPTTK